MERTVIRCSSFKSESKVTDCKESSQVKASSFFPQKLCGSEINTRILSLKLKSSELRFSHTMGLFKTPFERKSVSCWDQPLMRCRSGITQLCLPFSFLACESIWVIQAWGDLAWSQLKIERDPLDDRIRTVRRLWGGHLVADERQRRRGQVSGDAKSLRAKIVLSWFERKLSKLCYPRIRLIRFEVVQKTKQNNNWNKKIENQPLGVFRRNPRKLWIGWL